MSNPQRPAVIMVDAEYEGVVGMYSAEEADAYIDHLEEMRDLWKQSEADCANENRELRGTLEGVNTLLTIEGEANKKLATQCDLLARVVSRAKRYAVHAPGCATRSVPPLPCDCGYIEMLNETAWVYDHVV